MLPLLKKKSETAAVPLLPPWHPNFRNFERLPDIKVVRTTFFINGAAIAIALVAVTFFGIQEYNLHDLHSQLDQAQARIDRNKKGSDQAVALFKKFQAEETKIKEVDEFVKSKPAVSDLFLHLGQTLPPNIALDSLDVRDTGLSIRFTVRGASDAASGYANAYLEQLRGDKEMARFDDFQFASSARNNTTGRITVEFILRLKGAAPKK